MYQWMKAVLTFSALLILLITGSTSRKEENRRGLPFNSPFLSQTLKGFSPVHDNIVHEGRSTPGSYEVKPNYNTYIDNYPQIIPDKNNLQSEIDKTTTDRLPQFTGHSQEIAGKDGLRFENTQVNNAAKVINSRISEFNLEYSVDPGEKTEENDRNIENVSTISIIAVFDTRNFSLVSWKDNTSRHSRSVDDEGTLDDTNPLHTDILDAVPKALVDMEDEVSGTQLYDVASKKKVSEWGYIDLEDAIGDEKTLKCVLRPTEGYESERKLSILEKLALLTLIRLRNASNSQARRLVKFVTRNYSTEKNHYGNLLPILAAENNTLVSKLMLQNVEDVYVADCWNNTALHYAARNENALLVLAICEKDVGGVDKLNSRGETALLIAASRNNSQICQILLDNGAEPFIYNENGLSTFQFAIENENSEILELILSNTTWGTGKENEDLDKALWLAVTKSNSDITKKLLKAGADPYISYGNGDTCLHVAVLSENEDVVQTILSATTRGIDKQNSEGNTALSLGVNVGNLVLTDMLLKAKADPNVRNYVGQTSLHLAVGVESEAILEALLNDVRSRIDTRDRSGKTPLLLAAFNGFASILEALEINGADVNIPDFQGVSPLHVAIIFNDIEILNVLLNKGTAMPNLQDKEGNTPLHYAVDMSQMELVLLLLDNGADPKIRNNENRTSLHTAAALGEERMLFALLNGSKSFLEIQDHRGHTVLHLASAFGHKFLVKALLQHGANPNTRDKMGFNALRIAVDVFIDSTKSRREDPSESSKWFQIIQSLLKFDSDPFIQDEEGSTALHAASKAGNVEIVSIVLNHSTIGINIRKSDGSAALNLATIFRNIYVAEILLRYNADPYIQDNLGRTSLHLAVIYGQLELVLEILTKDKRGVDLTDASGRSAIIHAVYFPDEERLEKSYPTSEEEDKFIPIGALVRGVFCGRENRTAIGLAELRNCASMVSNQLLKSFVERLDRISVDETIAYTAHELPLEARSIGFGWSSSAMSPAGERYTPEEKRIIMFDYLILNGANHSTIDEKGDTIFHHAVRSRHLNVLEYLLKRVKAGEMNAKNNKGKTPLHYAAENEFFFVLEFLLANGVDTYVPDNSGRTALHRAAELQNLDILRLILNTSKAGINFRDNSGLTALSLSTRNGNSTRERCELLVQNGANPYVADNVENTALHATVIDSLQQTLYHEQRESISISKPQSNIRRIGFAPHSNFISFITQEVQLEGHKYDLLIPEIDSESVVELLLKHNSSGINMRNNYGHTALFLASLHSISDVDILLNTGGDPYIPDHEGRTSLHAAVVGCGNQNIFEDNCGYLNKMLSLNNSGVNMKDNLGYTALHYSISTFPSIVYILLENGANPNTRENRNGWTPLHIALRQKEVEFAKALLGNAETDVNAQNDDGQTPLHLAENEEIVNLLIQKGADVQQTDRRGWTVIHYLSFYGKYNIISQILLKNLSNINGQSLLGETPLSIATTRNNVPMVAYLLNMGAIPKLTHDFLKSPLEVAIAENNIQILQSLCRRVENVLAYNMFGLNAFHTASWVGTLEVVQTVYERLNETIDYPDRFGHTSLHYAAMGMQDRVLKYLLAEGASPLVIDHLGHNVLHYAAEGCRGLIIKAIILKAKETASKKDFTGFIGQQNFLDLTSIQLAAFKGNREAFVVLWDASEFSNKACDTSRESILFPAALGGDIGIINFILETTNLSVNWRTVTGISPAMAAAAKGRREVFQTLISKGARIDDVTAYGQTMLHFGAQGGETEIIETILKNSNVDINSRDVEGFTPLMNAVYYDNLDATELLLNYRADPHMQNVYGEDVIKIAAKVGNSVLKSRLFNASHNPDSSLGILLARRNPSYDKQIVIDLANKSSLNKYDIFLAAAKGNMTALRRSLSSPINLKNRRFPNLLKEITNDLGTIIMDIVEKDLPPLNDVSLSPLDIALMFGQNLTVIKYIIQNLKINPRSINYKAISWTPLDYALFTQSKFLSNSSTDVLLYLLDKCKLSLNDSTNIFGWTIAHKAAWTGNSHAISVLKHYGVDLNRLDNFGRTPLHYAALNGHSRLVNSILHASNISINKKDKYGFTPLVLSQVYNHRQFFRRFSTVSSDIPSIERFSLIQMSDYLSQISKSHDDSYIQTTLTLVANKADLDVQDKVFGWTALHWAVVNGDYQCVQLLTYTGAKVNIRSRTGETPLFLARKWMRKGTYNYLKSKDGVW